MGRVKKDTVEYFPHYVTHRATLPILDGKYGNDGVAFWWRLLEELGATPGHFLDLKSEERWQLFVVRVKLPEEKVREILDLLCRLEAINSKLWRGSRRIWSQNFVDGLVACYANRRRTPPTIPGPSSSIQHNTTPKKRITTSKKAPMTAISTVAIHQSRVEYSKVKNYLSLPIPVNGRERELSEYLKDRILAWKPTAKTPLKLTAWDREAGLMIRRDHREPARIVDVISWATSDPFWQPNILSMGKLREKFDQLEAKMGQRKAVATAPLPSAAAPKQDPAICSKNIRQTERGRRWCELETDGSCTHAYTATCRKLEGFPDVPSKEESTA
jgi:hypothetical protein